MAPRFVLATLMLLGLTAISAADEKSPCPHRTYDDEPTVQLEFHFLQVADGVADLIRKEVGPFENRQGRVLGAKQVRRLLDEAYGDRGTEVKRTPKLAIRDGQKLTMNSGELKFIVSGFKEKEQIWHAEATAREMPQYLGTRLDVFACASSDLTKVRIKFRAEVTERLAADNPLLPVRTTQTPVREFDIPNDRTLLLSGGTIQVERHETRRPVDTGIDCFDRLFATECRVHTQQQVLVLISARIVDQYQGDAMRTGVLESFAETLIERKAQSIVATCPALENQQKSKQSSCGECQDQPAICCSKRSTATHPTPTMAVADVTALAANGVSDEIILNQMRITGATFTLSTADIIYLKGNKVSDRVVIELQNSQLKGQLEVVPAAAFPLPAVAPAPVSPAAVPHLPAQPWVCPATFDAVAPAPAAANQEAAEFIEFLRDAAVDLFDGLSGMFLGSDDSHPNERMRKVLNESADLRQVQE